MICDPHLPLVTVLITTKDRPDDLRRTLHDLHRQDYPCIEMIVIDDGSADGLESIVREAWPAAVYVRHAESRGCPQRRSEGFLMVGGEYIVEFDDDSSPVASDALSHAVEYISDKPGVAVLGFHIYNGAILPEKNYTHAGARYDLNFVGCGVLFRTAIVREIGGYCAFFEGEWEESEYSLRMLKAGWSIWFFPDVLIHHRVSPLQRRSARSWSRGFRNKLWAMAMHYPLHRLVTEGAWVLILAGWDAIRLIRPRQFITGLSQFVSGLPRALRIREPMTRETMQLYDALRFRRITTERDFRAPPSCNILDLVAHYRRSWLNRPRQRSFWDRRPGDIGSSETVKFSHEFIGNTNPQSHNSSAPDRPAKNFP
jgi:GT2 family glycosyltransferase